MTRPAPPPEDLGFLHDKPQPVDPPADAAELEPQGLRLPPAVVEALMAVPGVQGVWVEGRTREEGVVVVQVDARWQPFTVAREIHGWPVRIHRGGPVRAL
jgi:hypothetical protein